MSRQTPVLSEWCELTSAGDATCYRKLLLPKSCEAQGFQATALIKAACLRSRECPPVLQNLTENNNLRYQNEINTHDIKAANIYQNCHRGTLRMNNILIFPWFSRVFFAFSSHPEVRCSVTCSGTVIFVNESLGSTCLAGPAVEKDALLLLLLYCFQNCKNQYFQRFFNFEAWKPGQTTLHYFLLIVCLSAIN